MEIDTPCLDCGQPIHVEMRDGAVVKAEPGEIQGYVAVPFGQWFQDAPYA